MKNKKFIRCNSVSYRQGYIEVRTDIHEKCINIETWGINPEIDISNLELTDKKISDEDVTSNTEVELSLENAENLVGLLQEAIKKVKPNEST